VRAKCVPDNENKRWEDMMTRGGILAGVAAVAVLAATFYVVGGPVAAQSKREAPLELKGDASEHPWKRYAGWPTRDYSKYNTLGNLATPPTVPSSWPTAPAVDHVWHVM
jgi:hypothetical protein